MPKIHQLSDQVIAQIAAGEVIERPSYAVKELLENAIDADADHIQLYLEDAGLKKIMIIDNGHGMSQEDIRKSYKHHTTSKLHESLIGIKSFGFRGEALSSIASISTMIIKSKTRDEAAGTMIEVSGGILKKEASVGMPVGTTITIYDLFRTVPARKKFLKSQKTEFRHCLEIVVQTAIAYPNIRFQLFHNGKSIIDFPKTPDMLDRVKSFFGSDIVNQMIPINGNESSVNVSGFIGTPHIVSTTSAKQLLFVNNRLVNDRLVSQTVKESYNTLIDSSSYPLFALFISLPHEMVDVNVHPRKEQLAFMNSDMIMQSIKKIISSAIESSNLTYAPYLLHKKPFASMPEYATSVLRDAVRPWGTKQVMKVMHSSDMAQFHNVYIVLQTYTGILFIDQHAAHERVLYEEYRKAFKQEKSRGEKIAPDDTIIIEITPDRALALSEHTATIQQLGFTYEQFGPDAIKITSIPKIFKDHDITLLFQEIITSCIEEKDIQVDKQSHTMLAYLACRSAVKAGDSLTKKECRELIEKLEQTENNTTCPHGRPTKVQLSLQEMHRYFKRS